MNQDSQRVLETKERIRDAFFELYATKKIERISIKEITEKAKLNRGTFYVYYKDIYDLLEKTEDEFLDELIEKIKGVITMILRDENIFGFLPPVEFYQRYSKYLRILLGKNGDPNFTHKIKTIIKRTLKELLKEEQIPMIPNLDYVIEYIASAQIGIMSYWLEKEMSLPVEVIGDMIKEISLHGPLGYLKAQAIQVEANTYL